MFESAGGSEPPEPVPMSVPEPDGDPSGPPGALQEQGSGLPGDGPDIDRVGWEGPPAWLSAIDDAGAGDPPVEHEPWPEADTALPWPQADTAPPWPQADTAPPWPEA